MLKGYILFVGIVAIAVSLTNCSTAETAAAVADEGTTTVADSLRNKRVEDAQTINADGVKPTQDLSNPKRPVSKKNPKKSDFNR